MTLVERGALALRPQLALQMLESRPRFSVDDVVALKYDTRLLLAGFHLGARRIGGREVGREGEPVT